MSVRALLRPHRVALACVVVALVAVVLPGPSGQTTPRGKVGSSIPGATEAGTWDGTWIYSSVDRKIALWIRTRDGLPEIKLGYQGLSSPDAFETDWTGNANYYLGGQPVVFQLRLDKRDPNRIEATWHWDVQWPDSGRSEDGTLAMYRALQGRSLVMKFDQFEHVTRRGDKTQRQQAKPVWVFEKASKRSDALWDELPF